MDGFPADAKLWDAQLAGLLPWRTWKEALAAMTSPADMAKGHWVHPRLRRDMNKVHQSSHVNRVVGHKNGNQRSILAGGSDVWNYHWNIHAVEAMQGSPGRSEWMNLLLLGTRWYSLGLRVLKLPKVKEGAVNNALGAAILPFGTQDAEEFTASRNGQEAGMYLSGIQHHRFNFDPIRYQNTRHWKTDSSHSIVNTWIWPVAMVLDSYQFSKRRFFLHRNKNGAVLQGRKTGCSMGGTWQCSLA